MKILIVGAGRVGKKIVDIIEFDRDEVFVIDSNEKMISEIGRSKKVKSYWGNALNKELLIEIGVANFDYVISVTDSDKTNILVSTLVKDLGAKYTITRINNADSIEELLYMKDVLGIDYIINPQLEAARAIEKLLDQNEYYQADTFGKGKIEVVGHNVELDPEFEGHAIKEIGSIATLLVVGIIKKNNLIIPNGDTVIEKGDYLYLMGLTKDIENFKMKYFRLAEKKAEKNVVIYGGGIIARRLGSIYQDHNVTIIEKDEAEVKRLRDSHGNAYVINADTSGYNFFKEYELENCDVFIALTGNDELNIVMSIMAKKMSVPQVFVKLNSMAYSKIIDEMDFTAIINPLTLSTNKIIKKLRYDRGVSMYLAFNGEAEVIEIKLTEDSEVIGKNLMEIKLPKGIIIGGIIRKNNSAIIPRGKSVFEEGDTVVIFCKNENRKELIRFLNPKDSIVHSIFY